MGRTGTGRTRLRRRSTRVAVGTLVVAAMVASNWWIVAQASDTDREDGGGVTGGEHASAAAGFAAYRDPGEGFAIDHPPSWRPESIPGGVLFRIGGRDAVSVKRTVLARPIDATNVGDMRAVTDAVLTAEESGLNVLAAKPTTLGGLPGMHYVYTFAADGLRGAHTHWFAFSGASMYTVVFQALPDTRLAALAPTFDAVAASFRVARAR